MTAISQEESWARGNSVARAAAAAYAKSESWDVSAPLGPGSLTWGHFGDIRSFLILGRAGTLQNMHPVLDAALRQHSNFFADPMDRFRRSVEPIHMMIYGDDPQQRAATVRDFHKPIKGTGDDGARYHAMDPEVYWWTHVTFYESVIATQELFGTPFTEEQKRQIVAEGLSWWRLYGMSERPAFGSYEDFQRYWAHMLRDVLGRNFTTDFARDIHRKKVPAPPFVPSALWPLVRYPVMAVGGWVTTGTMPPQAREILGWDWRRRDELAFALFRRAVRSGWRLLPQRWRYIPTAWRGMERSREQAEPSSGAGRPG
ncbi:MAG: oxygenase MpaB family protein [Segniliparus sp.]|uniref:oxygenase MpaB family protein n=1 Tax=Segniliparus sp. TaxID=2804064 RepID=UPI003F36C185